MNRIRLSIESRFSGTSSSSSTATPYVLSRKHDQFQHAGRVDDAHVQERVVVGEVVVAAEQEVLA